MRSRPSPPRGAQTRARTRGRTAPAADGRCAEDRRRRSRRARSRATARRDLPAVQLLGGEWIVERAGSRRARRRPKRGRSPPRCRRAPARLARLRSARFHFQLDRGTGRGRAPASSSPTGVASSKPAFFPRRTPGVASACSPKKLALTMHASEMRRRRASRRRRAAVVTPQLSAVADCCGAEHDPEVRRMVLPVLVERGPREEEREEG